MPIEFLFNFCYAALLDTWIVTDNRGLLFTTAAPRTIEPISKVERHLEECDVTVMLSQLNVTVL